MKLHFVGPVCWYDMLRMARRARYFLLRGLYALLLVSILCIMYGSAFSFFERQTQPKRMTEFGENFFNIFMIVQYFLALVLTPAYVAGAVAEEKERKTLEFILATDLQGQEIVLSKLASRLGNLILFLLAGLPVLSLVQLFGGVSPTLLWCGFGATGMAVLSAACLSILVSVYVKRAHDAIVRTTMALFGYFLFGLLLWWLLAAMESAKWGPTGAAAGAAEKSLYELGFAWFFECVMSGHIIYVLVRLFTSFDFTGLGWGRTPLELLRNFAIFHGAFALLFLGWACWRLRAVFIKQNYGTPLKAPKERRGWLRRRPPVGEYPMLWKERFIEAAARMTKGAVVFYVLCFLFALFPLGVMGWFYLFAAGNWRLDSDSFRQSMNLYVRIAGSIVAVLLLLGVGVRAASSVGGERDRQTLESLLSSPLTLREILAGKWFGAVLGSRPMFFLLIFIWGLGLITGGLHVAAPAVLLVALFAYAAFIASLGLYFSVSSKTTNRAMLWTVGITLFWGGLHWVCCGWPLMLAAQSNPMLYFLIGETPPIVLGLFAFSYEDVDHFFGRGDQTMVVMFCVLGVCLALGGAVLLWGAAQQRFLAVSGRIPPGYWPRRSPLAKTPEEV